MGKTKGNPKHSEYPDRVLKALIMKYDSDVDVRAKGASWASLCIEGGIFSDYTTSITPIKSQIDSRYFEEMNEVIRILKGENYVIDTGTSTPNEYLKPTYKGITHARWLMRPWYHKIWDTIKNDMRTIIIAIIIAILTTLLVNLLSGGK